MQRRHDIYRPGSRERDSSAKRTHTGDELNDRDQYWRRDQTVERQGRRFSDSTAQSERQESRSPGHINDYSRPRQARPPEGPLEKPPLQLNPPEPQSRTRPPPPTRSVSMSVTSHSTLPPDERQIESLQAGPKDKHTLRTSNQVDKSADPRLRPTVMDKTSNDEVQSPMESIAEHSGSIDFGDMVHAFNIPCMRYHDAKQRYEELKKEAAKRQQKLSTAKQVGLPDNPYNQQLRDEYYSIDTAIKKHVNFMATLKVQLSARKQDLTTYFKMREDEVSELRSVRATLAVQTETCVELAESNQRMEKLIKEQANIISQLSSRVEAVETQLSSHDTGLRLDTLQNLVETLSHQPLLDQSIALSSGASPVKVKDFLERMENQHNELAIRVQETHAEMMVLKNTSATKDALKHVDTAIADTRAKIDSVPRQPLAQGQVTHAELQSYVTVFNRFQDHMQNQISSLEKRNIITPSDLTQYVTNSTMTQFRVDLTATQADVNKSNDGLVALQKIVQKTARDTNTNTIKTTELSDSIAEMKRKSVETSTKINQLETVQRDLRVIAIQAQHLNKLQTDMKIIQNSQAGLDHAVRSMNQRFNNLTTEHLYRQILSSLDPFLSAVKPQIVKLQQELELFRNMQADLQHQSALISKGHTKSEIQISSLKDKSDEIDQQIRTLTDQMAGMKEATNDTAECLKTVQSIEPRLVSLQSDILSLNKANGESGETFDRIVTEALSNFDIELSDKLEQLRQNIEAAASTVTKEMIDQSTNEQQNKMTTLIEQVREARDSFGARLKIVEDLIDDQKIVETSSSSEIQTERTATGFQKEPQPYLSAQYDQAGRVNPKIPSRRSTDKLLQNKSEMKSNDSRSKGKSFGAPSLATHLKNSNRFSDASDDENTIDATPMSQRKGSTSIDPLHISESEPDGEQPASQASDRKSSLNEDVDLLDWTKPLKSRESKTKSPVVKSSTKIKDSSNLSKTPTSAEVVKPSKRKRESQGKSSGTNDHHTDAVRPAGPGRKKKKQ